MIIARYWNYEKNCVVTFWIPSESIFQVSYYMEMNGLNYKTWYFMIISDTISLHSIMRPMNLCSFKFYVKRMNQTHRRFYSTHNLSGSFQSSRAYFYWIRWIFQRYLLFHRKIKKYVNHAKNKTPYGCTKSIRGMFYDAIVRTIWASYLDAMAA